MLNQHVAFCFGVYTIKVTRLWEFSPFGQFFQPWAIYLFSIFANFFSEKAKKKCYAIFWAVFEAIGKFFHKIIWSPCKYTVASLNVLGMYIKLFFFRRMQISVHSFNKETFQAENVLAFLLLHLLENLFRTFVPENSEKNCFSFFYAGYRAATSTA
jgi:hypothetical protein